MTVEELFTSLETWTETEGARGCLFLRAQGESGASQSEVLNVVADYRRRLRELIGQLIVDELGREDEAVTDELLIVFEGATSAASYLGPQAVIVAQRAANALLDRAR